MSRFDYLHKMYRDKRLRERKERILQRSRTVVDTNAFGTSGYVIKEGVNAGTIMKHIIVDHPNKHFS